MAIYRRKKILLLYESKEWTDCTFIVGDEKITAHKLILACSSPVFESMFYGELASDEVVIEDIEADVFKKTLEYIYSDAIKIANVLEAWNLVYVSQKYFLSELLNICIDYVKHHLSMTNLLLSYEYALLYNETTLLEKCLDDIYLYTKGVILYSNYHMQVNTLKEILKENRGNTTDLIMLVISWAIEECAARKMITIKENIYSILKQHNILALLLGKSCMFYFNESIFKPLTRDQIFLFEHIIELSQQFQNDFSKYAPSVINNSSTKPDKTLPFKYRRFLKNSYKLPVVNEVYSLTIYSNKDCLIFGIVVSTKLKSPRSHHNEYIGGANIYIYMKSEDDNRSNLIFEHEDQRSFLEFNEEQKIIFVLPVYLKALTHYMICIEYVSDCCGETILLQHMSDKLFAHRDDKTVINFVEEGNGTVVRGLSFYGV